MVAPAKRMIGRSHLGFVAVLLAGMGCSEGTVSGPPTEDAGTDPSTKDAGEDPWAADEDGGPYPDDIGPEDFPLPPDDAGPKGSDPAMTWPEDAGEPPDPPAPLPEDGGDPPVPPVVDAGVPVVDAGRPVVDAGVPPAPALPALLPRFSAVFSRRSLDNQPDAAIEDLLVALIDRAVAGSRIRVAVYTFTRGRVTEALVRAAQRSVDVRVLLDGQVRATVDDPNDGTGVTEAASLIVGLGRSRVTLCRAPGSACLGVGIMHHKTYLFSDVGGGSRNVVVQASHNLTEGQMHRHNNAVIIRGDSQLFAGYERTFEQQRRDVVQLDYYRTADGNFPARAYFFPRPTGDTAVSVIDNVSCAGAARIRVAMAFFTNARLEVARALARRQRAGCDVQAVIGDDSIRVGRTVLRTLRDNGVRVTLYPRRPGNWGLHSKYLLIDARYNGSAAHRRLVFTGSHNWTGSALRENDETMVRVDDGAVFDGFMADWGHVRDSARRR